MAPLSEVQLIQSRLSEELRLQSTMCSWETVPDWQLKESPTYKNLPFVVALLGVEEGTARRNAAQTLRNICGVSGFWNDHVCRAGGLTRLLQLLQQETDDEHLLFGVPSESAFYALQTVVLLIRENPANTHSAVSNGAIAIMVRMLCANIHNRDCSSLSAEGLEQISKCDSRYTQCIREDGGLRALVAAIDALHTPHHSPFLDSLRDVEGPVRVRTSAALTRALMAMVPPPHEFDPDDMPLLLNRDAIVAAGGVSATIRILDEDPTLETVKFSLGVLERLSCEDEDVQNEIRAKGGIQKLVALIRKHSDLSQTQTVVNAVAALHQVGKNNHVNQELIRREGGIKALVHLLDLCEVNQPGLIVCARDALNALCVNNDTNAGAFLDAVADWLDLPDSIANDKSTLDLLQRAAVSRICGAVSGGEMDDNAHNMYDHETRTNLACDNARLVRLSVHDIQQAAARNRDAAGATKHKLEVDLKRKAMGIHDVPDPDEFVCPITLELMHDPVVASDGRSYERRAIERVLKSAKLTGAISPISREPLLDQLFENRNLRSRIAAHNEDLLFAAGMALTKASVDTDSQMCMRL